MFIRCTTIKSKQLGEPYKTYRLVESERVNGKVKQRTLLNLGRHFAVSKDQWAILSARISELLTAQHSLVSVELPAPLEMMAQRYVAQILESRSSFVADKGAFESVSLDTLELVRPRRVGIEYLALHALKQLKLDDKLKELGFNRHQLASALGNIIGRMALPASERATYDWLQNRSGLGELIDYDFEGMGRDRLYQASDLLWKHQQALEAHLYQQETALFDFNESITLYDLTNTFFEGDASLNPQAQRGRSKEKRKDCPLVTLGLVLDSGGFPRKSQMFAGNASEPETLQTMLQDLGGREGSIVIMDAGIASEDNIDWLREQGYRYLVVSRKRNREFDASKATIVKDIEGQTVKAQRVVNKDTGEIELYCHSQRREKKEQAMQDRFSERFEAALQSLANGLGKKGCTKNYDKILERIGRLKEKYARAAQHYEITVTPDSASKKTLSIEWTRREKPHTQATHPGVYCLRTNISDWDEKTLWKTYTMLTDLEGVFRSLKSELGMRPVYHHNKDRVNGHIFITLLAYHLVQTLRCQLKAQGISDSWQTLRTKMENQQRITVVLKREDGKTIHLRQTTRAEPYQKEIYDALGISSQREHTRKTLV
ncbi:MAG: IS1634 family transposase [Methylococcaceae bacterium]|nr:IS1634 family transposase [Methylococcaceae bacterium]